MFKKILKNRHLDILDAIPIFDIDEEVVIMKDGRVSVGFQLDLPEMETLSDSDIVSIHSRFMNCIKDLPVGTVVQKTDIYYELPYKFDHKDTKYFEGKVLKRFIDRPILNHKSYIFFSFAPFGKKKNPRTAGNTFLSRLGNSIVENPFDQIDLLIEDSKVKAAEAMSILGLKNKKLQENALLTLYYQYFNLEFNRPVDRFYRTISNDLSCVSVGEVKANTVNLMLQGNDVEDYINTTEGVIYPYSSRLSGYLTVPHILDQTLIIEDTQEALKALDKDFKINASLGFLSTQDNVLKAEEIIEYTGEARTFNKRFCSFNISILVYSEDDKKRKEAISKAVNAFRSLNGAEIMIDSYDTLNMFFALAPGNGDQIDRDRMRKHLTTDYFVKYCNFTTSYKSDKKGVILCDRFRNPLWVNLFNTELNNQNAICVGPPGSGKSYTNNYFIIQRYEQDSIQLIIDNGGTYKNMIEALNGEYFEYTIENPIKMNPFLTNQDEKGNYLLAPEKINFLISLIAVLWKGHDNPLSPAEGSILTILIPAYYQIVNKRKLKPSLTGFTDWMKEYRLEAGLDEELKIQLQYFDFNNFDVVLKPWTQGEYKQVLNADLQKNLTDKKLICFDLAKVKGNAKLYPVVAMLITELSVDHISLYEDKIKYIYMDEAWSLFNNPSMALWIEDIIRTIRKANGCLYLITQGVDEILALKMGKVLINCAETFIVLNHKKKIIAIDAVKDAFGLTEYEASMIKDIRVTESYREVFIKQGDTSKLYVIEASDELYAISTSKPVERNYLKKLIKQYGKIDHAVNQWTEDRNLKKGVFADA